jgi:cell division protein FtsW
MVIKNKLDKQFIFLLGILVIFGLIILTSASAPVGYAQFGDTHYFIKRQILRGLLPGILLFYLCTKIRYDFWKKISWFVYLFSVILLVLVFIPGLGLSINGARSWISIFDFNFQPAEFSKLAVVMIMSALLSDPNRDLNDWKNGLLPVLLILLPTIILIGLQPDIGTLSILALMIFVILFLSGVHKFYLLVLGSIAIVSFVVLLFMAPYRVQRLTTFLHPELDPKGVGYQINQSFLAVGSGGLWGLGFGMSRQKYQYLPEVHADSIFAIISEEMGFIINLLFIILLIFFGLRGFKIAKNSPDKFSYLFIGGVIVWFMWQSIMNIGSMVGAMPLTGVPLPFVSHGGSALMIALASCGIILNISKKTKLN